MDLGIELKGSKIIIKWQDVNADYYKVFCKKDVFFYECAKIFDNTQIRLSLVPYGDNECFVQAFKDGIVIAETAKHQFTFDTIDVINTFEGENSIKFFYSKYNGAKGYRLYKSEAETAFGGCKNSDAEFISVEKTEDTEYKIKPFTNNEEKGRVFLASSPAFKPAENCFKSVSIYKSFNYNSFLSWDFEGDADGFIVCTQNSNLPIFETNDGLRHYLTLTDFKGSTKFIVKAFVNTPQGRIIIAKSKPTILSIRKYEKPEVSLIIPAYNSKDYIARSIDSALASDFANLEIVIINDGSTDDTQKIIEWYDKNYENVVSIQKENGGVADTRNVGIKSANGEFIAFLDNDDLIRPNMISSLYKTITKNSCDIAIAPLYRITDKGYSTHCNLPFMEDIPIDIDKYLEIMYTPGYYNCAIWNKLYKASIVKEHPLGKLKYEDVSWTPCILSYAKTFCFLKTPFYEWDRKTREETFGDVLAKQSENDLFEHRKQAMLFFIENGNPQKRQFLKTIAKRRLTRYSKNSNNDNYQNLIKQIDKNYK
jgi:glycosyltransferase involved in cell wall biosynthesis